MIYGNILITKGYIITFLVFKLKQLDIYKKRLKLNIYISTIVFNDKKYKLHELLSFVSLNQNNRYYFLGILILFFPYLDHFNLLILS